MTLSTEAQDRMAVSAAVLVSHEQFVARCDAEIERIFQRHPTLPRTESVRRLLWGLAFKEFSRAVSEPLAAAPQAQPETRNAA